MYSENLMKHLNLMLTLEENERPDADDMMEKI